MREKKTPCSLKTIDIKQQQKKPYNNETDTQAKQLLDSMT